jgi:hypothetical protein
MCPAPGTHEGHRDHHWCRRNHRDRNRIQKLAIGEPPVLLGSGAVVATPELGGLHHRHERVAA